jgi:protein-tyrosine-phosphatase/DnaJ-domain-containing protein 1
MRILFVSDDDRVRGPIARALAERLARKSDLDGVVFDSAGLNTQGNEQGLLEAVAFMRSEKVNLLNHRSKPVTEATIDGADVVLCMTKVQVLETQKRFAEFARKIVLLNEGIDLTTKRMDIDPVGVANATNLRRLYASLSASMGRLVRTLEEPNVAPEFFGAKTLPKKHKPGSGGGGPRATEQTIDPERRRFLSNTLFDLLERAFEPCTTSSLLADLRMMGHELSQLELEELLRQDLHDSVKQDAHGVWNVAHGANEKRREKAKADARARATAQQKQAPPPPPRPASRKMTDDEAYEVLGITAQSAAGDVRGKYRALLKKYHPDKFHDDEEFRLLAEEKAKRINEAWNLLKDRYVESDDAVV